MDSAFASAVELADNVLAGIPAGMRPYLKFFGLPIASLHAGCSLDDVRPIDAVAQVRSPILFVHASDDTLIPVEHSVRLHCVAADPKDFLFTATGGHGSSFMTDRERYLAFVKKIELTGR